MSSVPQIHVQSVAVFGNRVSEDGIKRNEVIWVVVV